MKEKGNWEGMGAASGVLASVLFVLAFIAFLSTGPTGDTPIPTIEDAQDAPGFIGANLTSFRLEMLFMSLGIVLFLWFVGSLWSAFRSAEGDPGRGSMLMVVGASVGSALMLLGILSSFTSGLSTSPAQADSVPTLYTAAALTFAFGGGCLSLFFFAAGKIVLQAKVMASWIGWLAMLAGVLAALAFMTPFFPSGILNAATGVLGLWTWWIAFVLWVLIASLSLTIGERKRTRAVRTDAAGVERMAGTEGAL
jgi:hypothetical protein